jgi:hypothetical protein
VLVVLDDTGLCLNIISGAPRKERSVKKKRDVDDFCKGNVRQLIYRKYFKCRIEAIQ